MLDGQRSSDSVEYFLDIIFAFTLKAYLVIFVIILCGIK